MWSCSVSVMSVMILMYPRCTLLSKRAPKSRETRRIVAIARYRVLAIAKWRKLLFWLQTNERVSKHWYSYYSTGKKRRHRCQRESKRHGGRDPTKRCQSDIVFYLGCFYFYFYFQVDFIASVGVGMCVCVRVVLIGNQAATPVSF